MCDARCPRRLFVQKRIVLTLAALILASSVFGTSQTDSATIPTFVIHRPTIIAFHPPVSAAESDDPENAVLEDFQWYGMQFRQRRQSAGIQFHEAYVRAFRVRVGRTVTTFRPPKIKVGYYFIAPGKEPRVEYGVLTDDDLLRISSEYFGSVAK